MNRLTIFLPFFILVLFASCVDLPKKDFLEVTTLPPSDIKKTSAKLNGKINNLSFSKVVRFGFVWSSNIKLPTESINDGSHIVSKERQGGDFPPRLIQDLLPNKEYHARAFAQLEGDAQPTYGEPVPFVTNSVDFETFQVQYILGDTASILGNISGVDIDFPISQHGHVWSLTNKEPTINVDDFSNLGGVKSDGPFVSKMENLQSKKTYFIRAYLLINFGKNIIYGSTDTCKFDLIDIWKPKKDIPMGGIINPPSFTIDGKFYTGGKGGANQNFFEYNPQTDVWTPVTPYPGEGSDALLAFAIGKKGYVGLGSYDLSKKIWEFDSETREWTAPPEYEFIGKEPRRRTSNFVIDGKAYVIAGENYTEMEMNSQSFKLLKEVYRFDPEEGWTRLEDFSSARNAAMTFVVGKKGYFMGGLGKDVWEFDPTEGTKGKWNPKKDFPGGGTGFGTGFSINGKGYIANGISYGLGRSNVFWEYDPAQDKWTRRRNVPGPPRSRSSSFSINNKGYVCFGEISGGGGSDLWEYTPQKSN